MRYSTGLKKRSHLQGHRKRRKTPEVPGEKEGFGLSWIEYKTLRQYQSMGDMLDELRIYGFQAGVENLITRNRVFDTENGHNWLTVDLKPGGLK